MAQHQAEVDACVAHLTEHSEHYFNVVRGKRQDGVLWAVFTIVSRRGLDDGAGAPKKRVAVKRASFLPLTTVLNTNAPSLIQMFNSCDHTRQFVCWFTLESSEGEPLLSKVMSVDGDAQHHAGSPQQQHHHQQQQQQPSRTTSAARPAAEPHQSPASPSGDIAALKNDMNQFERSRYSRSNTTTPTRSHHAGQPTGANSARAGGGASPVGRGGRAGSPMMTGSVVGQQSYQQVLRMSMQVADSVADMGQSIDEVRADVQSLRHAVDTAPKAPPADVFSQVLARLDAMERRQLDMEQRVATFDEVQNRFFQQVSQIREQLGSSAHGGGGGVSSVEEERMRLADNRAREQSIRAKMDAPISYKSLVEDRARHEAAAAAGVSLPREPGRQAPTPVDIASRLTVDPPHIESEGSSSEDEQTATRLPPPAATPPVHRQPSASTSASQAAPTPASGARTPLPSSRSSSAAARTNAHNADGGGGSYRQARSQQEQQERTPSSSRGPSHANSESAGARGGGQPAGGGGGGDESLTDMIKSMERKLSRISLPAGGRK